MTQEVYTHVTDPMFDAAAEAADRVISDVIGSRDGSNETTDTTQRPVKDQGSGR
jgi:hypothetical protein